jgi:hypothetical protein
MRDSRLFRWRLFYPGIRARLVPLFAPLLAGALLAGCLATSVQVRSGNGDTAGVLVTVFADADAAKAGRANANGTLIEIFRLEGGKEVFLQRSLAGEWGLDGLPPGKYRVRVVAVLDDGGNIREVRSGDQETDLKLKPGQTAEVKVILKKTPTGLIVAATITVIVVVVALAILMHERDIPIPPPPPVDLLLPPAPLLHPVVMASELVIWPVPVGPPPGPGDAPRYEFPPPRVTSVFPTPGSVTASRRVTPTATISQPLDLRHLRPDNILAIGSLSGMITGVTREVDGLLRFEPDRDLVPGEMVTITIRAGGVVNEAGRRMTEDFSWSFRVAR